MMVEVYHHLVCISGPPLGGTTTTGRFLVPCGFCHMDSGSILREPKWHKLIRDAVKEGNLAPDKIAIDAIMEHLPTKTPPRLAMTGFPRSLPQCDWLIRGLVLPNHYRLTVIELRVSEQALWNRLQDRKKEGRTDDNEDTLKTRLSEFGRYSPLVREKLKGFADVYQGYYTVETDNLDVTATNAKIRSIVRREFLAMSQSKIKTVV